MKIAILGFLLALNHLFGTIVLPETRTSHGGR